GGRAFGRRVRGGGLPAAPSPRAAPPLLAGLVLLAAAVAWSARRHPAAWRALRLPTPPQPWFPVVQVAVAGVVVLLSLWVALDFDTLAERLAGPGALALLLAAGVLLTADRPPGVAPAWRLGVLGLGVAVLAELGWAFLDPAGPAPWLHRSVLLMATPGLLTAAHGVAPPPPPPPAPPR